MRSHLRALLTQAIEKTAKAGELNSTELPPLLLEPPKQREFGDLSTNVAMLWAKSAKKAPRAIAEAILKNIEDPDGILARQEIAGPGFLNFAFAPKFYFAQTARVGRGKQDTHRSRPWAKSSGGVCQRQSDRAAPCRSWPGGGDRRCLGALARSHRLHVEHEYYVNDAGNQMENLGLSIYARYREHIRRAGGVSRGRLSRRLCQRRRRGGQGSARR